jgi:UDP-N-acetylglucosamine 2-epimerase
MVRTMKVVSIVGARPQFIKSAPVSRELREVAQEILVHTGQHYDDSMSGVFFRDLNLPKPDYELGVGSGTQGKQTGEMLKKIEEVLLRELPDCVLVYGDTNSTLAGALAAAKLHIPVAHVEAGLRSFNRRMPEEINRVMTDHLSALLLCPTDTAVKNLEREGVNKGVYLTGDVMYDALLDGVTIAKNSSTILARLNLRPHGFVLATVHRAENTDDLKRLEGIAAALLQLAEGGHTVVFPVHPRTQKQLGKLSIKPHDRFIQIKPVSFLDMMALESMAHVILTDSGGIQKEAHWLQVPCLTLRDETEWIETVESGWNRLVGVDPRLILQAVAEARPGLRNGWLWEKGDASKNVARLVGTGGWR